MNIYVALILIATWITGLLQVEYEVPPKQNGEWPVGDLRQIDAVVNDIKNLKTLYQDLSQQQHKIDAMLVVKDERLIIERYFNDFDRSTTHDLRSVSKSVIVLLVGIAIDQGYINDVNDSVFKYLKTIKPEKNLDTRKDLIRIKDLITMSSGLDCDDMNRQSKGQEDRVYKKKNWLQYTVDLKMLASPGEAHAYCTMGMVLAAEAVSQASGMPLDEFADLYLFKPMGIVHLSWSHTSKKQYIPHSAKRLYMLPRDVAKIGQLVLNKGMWNGVELVSKSWITSLSEKHVKLGGLDYGYLWWHMPMGDINQLSPVPLVARGNGGQVIMVIESLNAVIVFTGSAYNSQDAIAPFVIINKLLIPLLNNLHHKSAN